MLKTIVIFFGIILINCTSAHKFRRYLKAVGGSGYYKIFMTLGTCKAMRIFNENKIWGKVTINRIFDIYYKSGNDHYTVSRVEITVVVNHSDLLAYSEAGLGRSEFSATLYLPSNTVVVFYNLQIFTCSKPVLENTGNVDDVKMMAFFDGSIK